MSAPAPAGSSGADLLARVLRADGPESYALLVRTPEASGAAPGAPVMEILVADAVDCDLLAQIPLHDADGTPREVLTLVPFRQVRERGYAAHDDGAPLRSLVVRERAQLPLADAIALLPSGLPEIEGKGFDVSDEAYVQTVREVIRDEIGRGEGANFVIRRDYLAHSDAGPREIVPRILRRLLEDEQGAYWTFAVVSPGVSVVGATPERHVSVVDGVATMNPISGTFRKPAGGVDAAEFAQFLMDTKEVEELFMVVDEELKMMSAVCSRGGHIQGPYLKEMSRVIHTEYLLTGHTDLDVRDVLRETMFAPTVTGSPMQNACAVIYRHEPTGRGYYSGVAALMTPQADGRHRLDAPILIRTAEISDDGLIRVRAGATLVRHSTPEGEVAETAGKAAGVLGALGLAPQFLTGFGAGRPAGAAAGPRRAGSQAAPRSGGELADDPAIVRALQARNEMLSPFWLAEQAAQQPSVLAGRRAVVIDVEDRFTTMLAHVLRHQGMQVDVLAWSETGEDGSLPAEYADVDVVVCGPGPGDPLDMSEPRIARLHAVVRHRREAGRALVAVCLSHQVLASQLGLPIEALDRPRQGLQLTVDLFGEPARIGFYNTYSARATPVAVAALASDGIEVAVDAASTDVFALRGPGFATIQGHAESVLSVDGIDALRTLTEHALG